jgi:hypothetical protein
VERDERQKNKGKGVIKYKRGNKTKEKGIEIYTNK